MKYFTIKSPIFLVPQLDMFEEYKKIDFFMEILEKSGVAEIINNVKSNDKICKGRIGYNPYNLFAAIIYCFAKFKATLRDIEDKCMFDIRTLYIMEGNIPDHSVIGKFINKYILPHHYEIFTTINKQIISELNLDISDVFNDGSKFEANANKYKFVWKPKKYHQKLDIKIKELIKNMEYNVELKQDKLITAYEFDILLKDYSTKQNIDINDISRGRGCRHKQCEKIILKGYEYLEKLLEYEEKENICGKDRNSFYKTDHDATAMMLKEDYYSKLSNDFHAGYNVQVMVSSLLILMYGVFQDRSDHYTFIPMNDLFFKYYGHYPKNECADSGYGIYSNYLYIKEHNIGNYVKYQAWNGESSGKSPQLFKIDENNNVVCLNSKIGKECMQNTHSRIKNGKFYIFENCNDCQFSYKCKAIMKEKNRNKDYRIKELSIEYELLKQEAKNNLLSPKGIEIRINRSIQVEGTFGQIKNNMSYERIRRRGLEKVSCEIMLMCLGVNIRRLLSSVDDIKFKKSCWKTSDDLQPEIFPSVKPKEKRLSRN